VIPADVAKSLQVAADTALRPVAQEQDIADRLSGLVAGQKVMAQIQAMQPNGTYRAIINQRNITLALPFSAKSGDSLELQVTESNGKLTLAVVAGQGEGGGDAAGGANASVSATLSRTGQLISMLYSGARDGGDGTSAVPLNGSQPIGTAPVSAQELLPQLKQAISQSGMFYEAHQAEWVEGRFSKTELLQEPQGKLSAPEAFGSAADPTPDLETTSALANSAVATAADAAPQRLAADSAALSASDKASATQTPGQLVAPQTQGLVQQQLEALATQNFSWQGQVWPGQEMRWEIDEDAGRNSQNDDKTAARWSTSLHLTLPTLGEIDARIRLQGNQITVSMAADNAQTRDLMRASGVSLRSALEQAGIVLTTMGVAELATEQHDGQAQQ
jgi:hypothetical protein